jgi:glycosyltransferase involved in cell wall biosynthesis
MSQPLISIVIPCYNGTSLIGETLRSILEQKFDNFEIIVVDDGSSDRLREKLDSFSDKRIKYIYQENQGVSAARNNGLLNSGGEYVIFFDADDKMDVDFLETRLNALLNNSSISFVCGEVQKFTGNVADNAYFRGTSADAIREILLYNKEVTTCPSNYLFRKNFLTQNKLLFNTHLSSTADKLFLIECSLKGKSDLVKGKGKLLYRVSGQSMSHHFTEKLVKDNEQYYAQLLKHKLIPSELRRQSLFMGSFMLSGSYRKLGKYGKAIAYAARAFVLLPGRFIKKILYA